MPLISIIIPIYNSEKYLEQCISSIQNQTITDIEIICVDDGSTDSSLQILHRLQLEDSRIKILTQKNLYAGVARNTGLKVALGTYILFCDSDDFVEPNYAKILYDSAIKNNADITLCNADKYNVKNNSYIPWNIYNKLYIPKKNVFSIKQLKQNIFSFSIASPICKLMKKSFIQNNNLYFQDTHHANDVYFSMLSYALADSIAYIDSPALYHYRVGMHTNLQSTKMKSPYDEMRALDLLYQNLIKLNFNSKYKKYFDYAFANYIITLLNFCLQTVINETDTSQNIINWFTKNYYNFVKKNSLFLAEEEFCFFSLFESYFINCTSKNLKQLYTNYNRITNTYINHLHFCVNKAGISYIFYSKRAQKELYYHFHSKLGLLRKKIFRS